MKKERRSKTISVYLTQTQFMHLRDIFQATTHRSFADFLSTLLMRKPIVRKYRNQSLDDWHLTAIGIKGRLETIQSSLESAVNMLKSQPPGDISEDALVYLMDQESDLKENIVIIKHLLINIYEKCKKEQNPPQR